MPATIDLTTKPDPRCVVVVHGRDDAARLALFDFLRAIDLRPLEWQALVRESRSASPYIGDVLSRAFEIGQAVVVLMTPDEAVTLRDDLRKSDEPALTDYQPRPNVLLEAGMALATHPDRTIIAELGTLRRISDLDGRHVVRLDGSSRSLHDLAERLRICQCPVATSGTDWLDGTRLSGVLQRQANGR